MNPTLPRHGGGENQMGTNHLSIDPRLYFWEHHRRKGIRVYLVFNDNSMVLCDDLSNSFPLVVIPMSPRECQAEACGSRAVFEAVLSPMRRHSGFQNSYWYHSTRKKEIYKFILVPGRQISKGVVFLMNYFLRTCL